MPFPGAGHGDCRDQAADARDAGDEGGGDCTAALTDPTGGSAEGRAAGAEGEV